MLRRPILVVAGLLLLAFGLGVEIGSYIGPRKIIKAVDPIHRESFRALEAPAPANPLPCVDIRNAGPLVGTSGCVAGLVSQPARLFPGFYCHQRGTGPGRLPVH